MLHSAGYAVELAESQKRALELAARGQIEAAIIVLSTDLASLSEELRDKVPRTIVLGTNRRNHPPELLAAGGRCIFGGSIGRAEFSISLADRRHRQERGRRDCPRAVSKNQGLQARPLRPHLCRWQRPGNGFDPRRDRVLAAFVGNPCRALSRDQLRRAVVGRGADPMIAASTCSSPGCGAR